MQLSTTYGIHGSRYEEDRWMDHALLTLACWYVGPVSSLSTSDDGLPLQNVARRTATSCYAVVYVTASLARTLGNDEVSDCTPHH